MESQPTSEASTLTLRVNELRNHEGVVRYAVFSSPEGFPTDTTKAAKTGYAEVTGSPLDIPLTDLPYGRYAVTLFHDENSNDKFDTMLGLPKEGFGFSQNPKVWKGAPKFQQADFEFSPDSKVVEVTVKYL